MKLYSLPSVISGLIFDIDKTLYSNADYEYEQIDCQVREYARITGISAEKARSLVADERRKWAETHNGAKICLASIMLSFGIPINTSIEWRKSLINPENYLVKDVKLRETLTVLNKKYKMICVTNNPVNIAFRTLSALGIEDFFPNVIGLDTFMVSKPNKKPFIEACSKINCPITECISIGDRYDIDLAIPLELGMGAILIEKLDDLYTLVNI